MGQMLTPCVLRPSQEAFQDSCAILHSPQQFIKVPIFSSSHNTGCEVAFGL